MVSTKKTGNSKERPKAKHTADKKSGGLDEIDYLFAEKKKQKQDAKKQEAAQKQQKRNRKKHAAQSQPRASTSTKDWVDDGLGGKYNSEGYTGRVEDGIKVFKTHLLQSSKSGTTADCPFDCDCCYI